MRGVRSATFGKAARVAAAVAMLAAGCSAAHASAGKSPTSSAALAARSSTPKQIAVALAHHLLTEAVLPPGAKLYTGPLPKVLQRPADEPGIGNLIQTHRVWTVVGTIGDVAGFLNANPPDGLEASGTGTSSIGGEKSYFFDHELRTLPLNISTADLEIEAASGATGDVLVRADAQVGWTQPRPVDEYASPADAVVTVSVVHFLERGKPVGERVVETSPGLVKTIIGDFNALRLEAPQESFSCPAMGSDSVAYRVAFAASATATPVVVATIQACGGTGVTVNGHAAPALDGDAAFDDAVANVLGLKTPHFG